ncbi:MAG: hypothetical protein LBI20_00405 [Holosporales bacterium]|jgi:hypothetical protein|nr:hypothetical protein [Holosporales bacterium]
MKKLIKIGLVAYIVECLQASEATKFFNFSDIVRNDLGEKSVTLPKNNTFEAASIVYCALLPNSREELFKLNARHANAFGRDLMSEEELNALAIGRLYGAVAYTMYNLFGAEIWRQGDRSIAKSLQADFRGRLQEEYGSELGLLMYTTIYNLGAMEGNFDDILQKPEAFQTLLQYLNTQRNLRHIPADPVRLGPITMWEIISEAVTVLGLVWRSLIEFHV